MKFTYLLIDFFTILVPFIFSFHPKIKFNKVWPSFLPATITAAIIFMFWDIYFTRIGVWGFNPAYVCGHYIANLPVEEVLFFFCIPYSCVFTFHCFTLFITRTFPVKRVNLITIFLIVGSAGLSVIYHARFYTTATFAVLSGLLFIAQFIMRVSWLPKFFITYLVLLIPFLIVNGMLTGTGLHQPVVWYNNSQNLGLRILTIPVEDVFYGMDLVLLNLMLLNFFNRKVYN